MDQNSESSMDVVLCIGEIMRNIGKSRLIAGAVCIIFGLSACTYGEQTQQAEVKPEIISEKIKLNVMYSRDDITWSLVMDDLCSKFEDENPDIDLELQDSGSGIYGESLKVKEALNEFPDLFEIQNVDGYVNNDRIGEIPPSVSNLIEEPTYIDGKIYTVPLYTTTYGIIYNQVLFKKYNLKVPETYDDFLSVCHTLSQHGIVPLTGGGTKEDSIAYWLNYFYHKDVLSRTEGQHNQKPDFSQSYYQDMLKNYRHLVSGRYVLKDSIYMNDSQIISQFLDSQVAMYYAKPSFIANIILADPDCMSSTKDNMGMEIEDDSSKVRLAWFFVPAENGDVMAPTEIGSQFAISKECAQDPDKYKAAERFLTFLFEDENYRGILQSMYGFQTTKKRVLYPAPSVQQYLIIDYRYAGKEESFLDTNHISGGFKSELSKALYLLLGNSMTVEETAIYLNQQWRESNE